MLKNNTIGQDSYGDTAPVNDHQYTIGSYVRTDIRSKYKENQDTMSQIKRGSVFTEAGQLDPAAISSRLMSIRKKYGDKETRSYLPETPEKGPLNESQKINHIDRMKGSFDREPKSPSFMQIDSSEKAYIAKAHNSKQISQIMPDKYEMRRNGSFGALNEPEVGRFSEAPAKATQELKYYQKYSMKTESDARPSSDYKIDLRQIGPGNIKHNRPQDANEDARIDSINKINWKIKEILKCINEGQKTEETRKKKEEPTNGQIVQQRTRLSTQVGYTKIQNYTVYNKEEKKEYGRLSTPANQQKYGFTMKQDNVRSSNNLSIKFSEAQSKAKEFDLEMLKIQEKIKKSDEEKRRLNIKFDENRFNVSLPKSQNKAVITKNIQREEVKKAQQEKPIEAKFEEPKKTPRTLKNLDQLQIQRVNITSTHSTRIKTENSEANHQVFRRQDDSIPKAEPFSLKLIPVECDIDDDNTTSFVDCFKQQVKLDQDLRNAKLWLKDADPESIKWTEIQQLLKKNDIDMTIECIKSTFDSSSQEHNPFFTSRESDDTVQSLISKYIKATQHWNNNILKKYSRKSLLKENFTQQRMDLQKKGHLTVQDFVRFLNIETGTFYRNRDLILIFRRLGTGQELQFSKIIEQLAKD